MKILNNFKVVSLDHKLSQNTFNNVFKHFNVYLLFTGFFVGSASLVTPVYSTEISETSIRGILGSFYAFGCASGALLNNLLGAFMHWYDLTVLISLIPGKCASYFMTQMQT